MKELCRISGKVKMTKNAAKKLKQAAVDIHHWYKCDKCGSYHVSSTPKNSNR